MTTVRQRLPFFIALLFSALSQAFAAEEAPSPAAVRAALADSVRSQSLQTDFVEDWDKDNTRDAPPRSGGGGAGGRDAPISAASANTMLWIAIGLFVLVLAMIARDNIGAVRGKNRPSKTRHADPVEPAAHRRMQAARDDADVLADAGQFAEAMHILLLQGLGEMRRRLHISIATSLTSREILDSFHLDADARSALADIVGRVEVSYFGRHDPNQADYLACRESYSKLTGMLRREVAQ